jgi:hypothetical protein
LLQNTNPQGDVIFTCGRLNQNSIASANCIFVVTSRNYDLVLKGQIVNPNPSKSTVNSIATPPFSFVIGDTTQLSNPNVRKVVANNIVLKHVPRNQVVSLPSAKAKINKISKQGVMPSAFWLNCDEAQDFHNLIP